MEGTIEILGIKYWKDNVADIYRSWQLFNPHTCTAWNLIKIKI